MCPFSSRPDFGKRIHNSPEGFTVVRTEQAGHIFQDEPTCAASFPNRDNVIYQPSFVFGSFVFSRHAHWLAKLREARCDDVNGLHVTADLGEVAKVGDVWVVVGHDM